MKKQAPRSMEEQAQRSMEEQVQCSTAANVDFNVPDSDPVNTDWLWSIVSARRMSTSAPTSDAPDPAPPTSDAPDPAPPAKRQKRTSKKSKTRSEASIDDPDFNETVLIPRGVEVWRDPTKTAGAFPDTYFGAENKLPASEKKAFYHKKHGGEEMEIFRDGGPAFEGRVAKQYMTYDSWRVVERRWSNMALKYFLEQEVLDSSHKKTQQFFAERRDEESIQPDETTGWQAFPVLAEDEFTKGYSFNLFPDAMYWLSLQAFSMQWTSIAIKYTHIYQLRAMCPYLSVEYKKDAFDTTAIRKGINQMTCAAVLSLYNRWRLRFSVLKTRQNASWTAADDEAVRHYGLLITGALFEVWIAEPKIDPSGQWNGSRVRRLGFGELKAEADVGLLVNWVNEIHSWGLSKHAKWVKEDIELLARKGGHENALKMVAADK